MPINSLANILRGGVNNTQPNTQSVPYEAAIGKIKRQRDMANLLRTQALQPQQGEIIGGGGGGSIFGERPGIYVGATPTQAIMRGLTGAAGQVMDRNTDVQEQEHEKRTNDAYRLLGQGEGTVEELLNLGTHEARQVALGQIAGRPALKNALEMKQAEIEARIAKDAILQANINARTDKNIEAVDRRFNQSQDRADARAAMRGSGSPKLRAKVHTLRNNATGEVETGHYDDQGKFIRSETHSAIGSDKQVKEGRHNAGLWTQLQYVKQLTAANPHAFGNKAMLGSAIANRTHPDTAKVRIALNRLKSAEIKDKYGVSVTGGEKEIMTGFLPTESDLPEEVMSKIQEYENELIARGYHTAGEGDNVLPKHLQDQVISYPDKGPELNPVKFIFGRDVKPSGGSVTNQVLNEALGTSAPVAPKTLTKTLGGSKPQAPAAAIQELMNDPSPEAIAEFGQYFALPPGIR